MLRWIWIFFLFGNLLKVKLCSWWYSELFSFLTSAIGKIQQDMVVYFLVLFLNDIAFWSGPKKLCVCSSVSALTLFTSKMVPIFVHINTFLSINCLFYPLLCLQIGFATILCKTGCHIASLYVWCSRGSLFHAESRFQIPCMFWWIIFLLKPG